jgi:farnesol dehydrogenase
MKIFVSGATGFIGSNLVMALAKEGNIVHAIYRSKKKTENINDKNIKWFPGDILDTESLKTAMEGCEQVYHIAAYAAVSETNPGDFTKFNVQGTINVIGAAEQTGINNIVVTSTAGVFGPSIKGMVTEKSDSPLPHFTGYERSKAEAERLIADRVKKGMRIIIVSPTRVFGPGPLNESNSVTKIIKQYINGKWHILPGNGNSIGNYVYVDDIVNGHILAMQKGKTGEKYILAGENVSYNDFFQTIGKIAGKKQTLYSLPLPFMLAMAYFFVFLQKILKLKPLITPPLVRKYNYDWVVSCKKAEVELGYNFDNFETGARKTINWLNQKRIK